MTLRHRPERAPYTYPDAGLIGGLGLAILAAGTPPASLFIGAAGALTGLYIAVRRHQQGAPQ